MKKILIFIFLPFGLFSQTSIKVEGLYDSIQTTYKEAALSCRNEKNQDDEENTDIVCPNKLVEAILLDVFKYYDLELSYSSALQKSAYMETQDYKEKLSKLKRIKTDYTSHNLYLETNKDSRFEIGDYDLKRGGFNIYLGSDYQGDKKGYSISPKKKYWMSSKNNYQFRQLPISQFCFFFPINKREALEIENSTVNDIKMILLFKPKSVVKFKSKPFSDYIETFVTTDKVEVIILNSATSAQYYRKSFIDLKR